MSRRGAPQLLAWTQSAEWRAMASRQAKKNLRSLSLRPKCGAMCRTTGLECRNPVIDGRTRCRLHGGRSPAGDSWGKPVWPNRNSSKANAKLNRKLHDLQRAAAKRAKRVARMTPEELAAYRKWKGAHEPTSKADRARRRVLRRQNLEARKLTEQLANAPPKPKTDLELEIERLKAELELSQQFRKGVFA
jgi:hypothetical protein